MRARRLSLGLVAIALAPLALLLAAACGSDAATEDEGSPLPTSDAGRDGGARDAASTRAREGGCAKTTGECDLVLQDCPPDPQGQAQECVPASDGKGGFEAICIPVQPSQQLPIGRACCPDAPGGNPCLPGLSCVGQACGDGGIQTGRCAPPCCPGDDQACGQSDPEGIAGLCDLTLVDSTSSKELYSTCSYRERCKPFGLEPCGAGQTCLVDDEVGSASCIGSYEKALDEPCGFSNDCKDGLYCISAGDGGSRCRLGCLTPGAVHPFDPSVEDAGAGKGGCAAGQTCDLGPVPGLPPWLSFCR